MCCVIWPRKVSFPLWLQRGSFTCQGLGTPSDCTSPAMGKHILLRVLGFEQRAWTRASFEKMTLMNQHHVLFIKKKRGTKKKQTRLRVSLFSGASHVRRIRLPISQWPDPRVLWRARHRHRQETEKIAKARGGASWQFAICMSELF